MFIIMFYSGCVGAFVKVIDIPEEVSVQLEEDVKEYERYELKNIKYKKIKFISSTSCQNNFLTDKPSSVKNAKDQLKYIAFNNGGNGIGSVKCEKDGTSFGKNCWNSVSCYGYSLKVYKKDNNLVLKSTSGTGFFISKNGHILTNAHVINNSSKLLVYINKKEYKAVLITKDVVNDIAIIKIEYNSTPLVLQMKEKSKIGTEITVLGYPNIKLQGNDKKATFGYINSTSGVLADKRFLQISAPIQPGNSGSPLVNNKGEVLGIITSTLNQKVALKNTGSLAQNVNYAIKITYAMTLLIENNITLENIIPTKDLSRVKLVENINDSVVLIYSKR